MYRYVAPAAAEKTRVQHQMFLCYYSDVFTCVNIHRRLLKSIGGFRGAFPAGTFPVDSLAVVMNRVMCVPSLRQHCCHRDESSVADVIPGP
jgi:hypothetical protein